MIIESLKESEIPIIAELEKKSFSKPWSEKSIRESFKNTSCHFYTAKDDVLAGYIGISIAADEGYILNIAVFPEYRGKGIGKALVKFLIEKYKNELSFLTLEVRPSNSAAVNLYSSFGFIKAGERKNYYSDPTENALLLTKYFNSEKEI